MSKAITYINVRDANEEIETAKQKLFTLAPDFQQAIMRDAVTIAALEATVAELTATLRLVKATFSDMKTAAFINGEEYRKCLKEVNRVVG